MHSRGEKRRKKVPSNANGELKTVKKTALHATPEGNGRNGQKKKGGKEKGGGGKEG